jgi:hypothetical protein
MMTFSTSAQLHDIRSGMGKNQDPHDAIRRRVQNWLTTRFNNVVPQESQECFWQLTGLDEMGGGLDVSQFRSKPELIYIQGTIKLSPVHQQKFVKMSPKERFDFISELRLMLLSIDVEFSGIDDPLETILIVNPLFVDTLNRDAFINKLAWVNRGVLSMIVMLDRKFNDGVQSPRFNPIIN